MMVEPSRRCELLTVYERSVLQWRSCLRIQFPGTGIFEERQAAGVSPEASEVEVNDHPEFKVGPRHRPEKSDRYRLPGTVYLVSFSPVFSPLANPRYPQEN
jgi:hypothetical protein